MLLDKIFTIIMSIVWTFGAIFYITTGSDIINMSDNFAHKLVGGFIMLGGFSIFLLVISAVKEHFFQQ